MRTEMSASNVPPSFLCFLPEAHGKLSYVQSNGTHNVPELSTQYTSNVANKIFQIQKVCNGTHGSQTSSVENSDHKIDLINVEGSVNDNSEVRNITGNGDDRTSNGPEEPAIPNRASTPDLVDVSFRMPLQYTELYEACDLRRVSTSSMDETRDVIRMSTGSVDELAFEISEFFSAFEGDHQHLLVGMKLRSESYREQGAERTKSVIELSKNGTHGSEVPADFKVEGSNGALVPAIINSVGCSEKWCDGAESGSVSVTFSGPIPLSGPISYIGPSNHIPYSGSLSHRSDSSTASTRSFAFPILPCEWNSSPVKMAQPDKRYFQRRWRWRVCRFFCCKGSPSFD